MVLPVLLITLLSLFIFTCNSVPATLPVLHLFFYPYICHYICIYKFTCRPFSSFYVPLKSVYICPIHLSFYLCFYMPVCVSVELYLSMYTPVFTCQSENVFICPSLHIGVLMYSRTPLQPYLSLYVYIIFHLSFACPCLNVISIGTLLHLQFLLLSVRPHSCLSVFPCPAVGGPEAASLLLHCSLALIPR